MYTRWTYQLGFQIDLRTILLSIAGLYMGSLPTFIAVIIMIVYRLLLGGDYAHIGIALIISSGLIGIGWRYLQKKKGAKITIKSLFLLGLLVHMNMFILPFFMADGNFLNNVKIIAFPILIIYPFITILVGLLLNNQLENWKNRKAKERLQESEQRFANMMGDINMFFINI